MLPRRACAAALAPGGSTRRLEQSPGPCSFAFWLHARIRRTKQGPPYHIRSLAFRGNRNSGSCPINWSPSPYINMTASDTTHLSAFRHIPGSTQSSQYGCSLHTSRTATCGTVDSRFVIYQFVL